MAGFFFSVFSFRRVRAFKMICKYDEYAASGRHHHIATLSPGASFQGLYLLTSPPAVVTRNNEEYYSFIVSDLTGSMPCLIPVSRVHWHQCPEFQSQRILIEGCAALIEDSLTALVRDLEPVKVIW